mmetsp:Transcript_12406/g.15388  ORF Transcript_12406/g.15388 Transcript_12406/m.15388 type:complete len:265 (-) Transcript_12406:1019-1813(-)
MSSTRVASFKTFSLFSRAGKGTTVGKASSTTTNIQLNTGDLDVDDFPEIILDNFEQQKPQNRFYTHSHQASTEEHNPVSTAIEHLSSLRLGKDNLPHRFRCTESVLPFVMNSIGNSISLDQLKLSLGEVSVSTVHTHTHMIGSDIPLCNSHTSSDKNKHRKVPVNLTWIVVFAFSICTLSLLFDELFFSHDHIYGAGTMWSSPHVTTSGREIGYSTQTTQSENVLTLISSREHHALARTAALFVFFVILTIWGASAYIYYLKSV